MKIHLTRSFVLMLLVHFGTSFKKRTKSDLRVSYGEDDTDQSYPFVGVIGKLIRSSDVDDVSTTAVRKCTGSLIAQEWVLTAAHCIIKGNDKMYKDGTIKIYFGDLSNFPNTTYSRNILKRFPHFRYSKASGNNRHDIGLVLIERLDNLHLGQVSAVDYMSLIGRPVKYVGAGSTKFIDIFKNRTAGLDMFNFGDLKKALQIGEAVVAKCDESAYETGVKSVRTLWNFLQGKSFYGSLLCLRPKCSKRHQRNQPADSGGPALYDGKIVGVTLGVIMEYHSVYTAVSPYLDWIDGVISA